MNKHAVSLESETPEIMKALGRLHTKNISDELDPTIHNLVLLRASQINKCAYCIDMHIREARADGETQDRLNRVIVWDEVDDFSDRERAALAWTEALTVLPAISDMAKLRADLKAHYSDREIALLTAAIAMINLWNRINISGHRGQ